MSSDKSALIIGPGFIGWNVLDLLVGDGYSITGFVRRQAHADRIKASGARRVVMGDLDDKNLITEETKKHNIVFHTATADHLPSVEAVLDGIRARAKEGKETVFLHTSGTSVLEDGALGAFKSDKVYRDDKPEEIDALPDSNLHREIDLTIVRAQKELLSTGLAKMAIVIPPTIYGWTHGRGTIQLPTLTQFALKHGYVPTIGPGLSVESNIHVLDLARAYVVILNYLFSLPASSPALQNPYWFCEATGDDEPNWYEIASHLAKTLREAGRSVEEKPRALEGKGHWGELFGDATGGVIGLNSRSRAVRLRGLGWEPKEKAWRESWTVEELPNVLKAWDEKVKAT